MEGQPQIPAGMSPQGFSWSTALDNYEPTRNHGSGKGTRYIMDGEMRIRLEDGIDDLKDGVNAAYFVDDGRTVVPMYVAGWQPGNPSHPEGCAPSILLHPFPTNGRIRPDNGRPADFSSWMLGPRKAFHLKVSF